MNIIPVFLCVSLTNLSRTQFFVCLCVCVCSSLSALGENFAKTVSISQTFQTRTFQSHFHSPETAWEGRGNPCSAFWGVQLWLSECFHLPTHEYVLSKAMFLFFLLSWRGQDAEIFELGISRKIYSKVGAENGSSCLHSNGRFDPPHPEAKIPPKAGTLPTAIPAETVHFHRAKKSCLNLY